MSAAALLLALAGAAAPAFAQSTAISERHVQLLDQLSSAQAKALAAAYPGFRLLAVCKPEEDDQLVLGLLDKKVVRRVGVLFGKRGWELHDIDAELKKDEKVSRSFPMRWQYRLDERGFSAELKCGVDPALRHDADLKPGVGDRRLFDMKLAGVPAGARPVCFPTSDVYNNWDCVVFSPKDGRYRLWYQQAHAD